MAVCMMASLAQAQNTTVNSERATYAKALYVGAGFGFDHGGLGLKASFEPLKHLGLFGGVGYNLAGVAGNGGLIFNILPARKVTPTLIAMYGYNAVLQIKSTGNNGETVKNSAMFDGLTFGAGLDVKWGRQPQKISFSLLVPLRNHAFFDNYNYFKSVGYEFSPDIVPVAASVGWSMNLFRAK